MKITSFFLLIILFGATSCSREESFEVGVPARGSLQSAATGECLTKVVAGSFIAGNAATDSNYLEVDVNVTTAGAYTIKTDTINGYSFSATGNFAATGINRVRMPARGTPIVAGDDPFTVLFDTSFCFVPVTVLPAGSNSGPATFTLQSAGDSCMGAAVAGSYAQGAALGSANTVAIKVNVTVPGTFNVTTNAVNGYLFAGTGALAATGEQVIILTASGTPLAEGANVFTVTLSGGSSCTFPVQVVKGAVAATGDLFPLSADSYWTYVFDVAAPNDSIQVRNAGTISFAGNTYRNFEFSIDGAPYDSLYYRKSGTDYLEYVNLRDFLGEELETDTAGDVLFLKENLNTNDSWYTDFPVRLGGADVTLRLLFTCTEANTTATVNGKPFSGVYKTLLKLQLGSGGVFADAGPEIETFYAKGIGLIYENGNEDAGDLERQIKNWKVN